VLKQSISHLSLSISNLLLTALRGTSPWQFATHNGMWSSAWAPFRQFCSWPVFLAHHAVEFHQIISREFFAQPAISFQSGLHYPLSSSLLVLVVSSLLLANLHGNSQRPLEHRRVTTTPNPLLDQALHQVLPDAFDIQDTFASERFCSRVKQHDE
jgi:hypothetical protein